MLVEVGKRPEEREELSLERLGRDCRENAGRDRGTLTVTDATVTGNRRATDWQS